MTTANLATLKRRVGSTTANDDTTLSEVLEAAQDHIIERVGVDNAFANGAQEAMLLLAAKLFQRRRSPEGWSGISDLGVVRVISRDPDIESLIERYLDTANLGMA